MIDIVSMEQGKDLGIQNTDAPRAANILSVQLGSLEYAPEMGIDLAYFLSESFQFQNESFLNYLIEVLANNSLNVSSVIELVKTLHTDLIINLAPGNNSTGLLAR